MYIRPLKHEDAELFRCLRIFAIKDTPSAFSESVAEVLQRSRVECAEQLDSHGRGDFVLGAFDDEDQLIGMAGFYREPLTRMAHKGTLWGVYVRPEQRRQGICSALINAVIERVQSLPDMLSLHLRVTASNETAKQLYEKHGFYTYGIEPKALHVDGTYYDEVLMQRKFAQASTNPELRI